MGVQERHLGSSEKESNQEANSIHQSLQGIDYYTRGACDVRTPRNSEKRVNIRRSEELSIHQSLLRGSTYYTRDCDVPMILDRHCPFKGEKYISAIFADF
jgi:hypothetical protein